LKSVLETVTFDRSTLLQNFCLKQLNKTDIYESKFKAVYEDIERGKDNYANA
jgi:hypothetical protein